MASPNVTKRVWAGKFALIPLVIVMGTVFLSLWYATQYVAARLGYQSQLGAPLVVWFGFPVYRPWSLIPWNYWYHYYARDIFGAGMLRLAIGAIASIPMALGYAVWNARRARVATSQGTATWLEEPELPKARLQDREGVILALTQNGRYLRDATERHILAVAPTGSGKGVGQIIPTLLTWSESLVVHDIKGENWEVTAGYRAKSSNILYFNPCDINSCHFNPLLEIRPGVNQVKDAQNIVVMLIDPLGKKDPPFWEREAATLLVACLLHVLHSEEDKTLSGVAYFLSDPNRSATETIDMMRTRVYGDRATTRFINSSAQQAAQKYEKELSGVVSTCLSVLGLYRDPLIEQITADSDFRIMDLVESKNPVSLYLVIPPSDHLRIMPLVRLMWSQIGRRLMEEHSPTAKRHRMLFMMDEFPTLGYMEIFHTGISTIRGYGVKVFIITQGVTQLEDVYGPNHPFTINCDIRTYNTPNDNKTAEGISVALGVKTELIQQKTYTGHRLAPWLAHMMIADQETARPLLTPGEVLTFSNEETLVFVKGMSPLRARKLRYFQDAELMKRVLPAPRLTSKRPYPYRVQPTANPWLQLAKKAGATGAAGRAQMRGANEERNDEREREIEIAPVIAEPGPAPENAVGGERELMPPDHQVIQMDRWHERALMEAEEASREVDERGDTDTVRRAAFDREEAQRRERLERRLRAREADRGR